MKLANDTDVKISRAYGEYATSANVREIAKGSDIVVVLWLLAVFIAF
jgi:hypothetical protein